MLDLSEMAYGKKVVVPSSDELQRIFKKKKFKKSQALSSRKSQNESMEGSRRSPPNQSQVEIVEVGGSDLELPEHGVFVGG